MRPGACSPLVPRELRAMLAFMQRKLLSLGETAERTGLPVAWLTREADAGRLPCIRVGRRRMFNLEAVLSALEARHESGSASTRPSEAEGGR